MYPVKLVEALVYPVKLVEALVYPVNDLEDLILLTTGALKPPIHRAKNDLKPALLMLGQLL